MEIYIASWLSKDLNKVSLLLQNLGSSFLLLILKNVCRYAAQLLIINVTWQSNTIPQKSESLEYIWIFASPYTTFEISFMKTKWEFKWSGVEPNLWWKFEFYVSFDQWEWKIALMWPIKGPGKIGCRIPTIPADVWCQCNNFNKPTISD